MDDTCEGGHHREVLARLGVPHAYGAGGVPGGRQGTPVDRGRREAGHRGPRGVGRRHEPPGRCVRSLPLTGSPSRSDSPWTVAITVRPATVPKVSAVGRPEDSRVARTSPVAASHTVTGPLMSVSARRSSRRAVRPTAARPRGPTAPRRTPRQRRAVGPRREPSAGAAPEAGVTAGPGTGVAGPAVPVRGPPSREARPASPPLDACPATHVPRLTHRGAPRHEARHLGTHLRTTRVTGIAPPVAPVPRTREHHRRPAYPQRLQQPGSASVSGPGGQGRPSAR